MADLIRSWLLDPTALLFLVAFLCVTFGVVSSRRRAASEYGSSKGQVASVLVVLATFVVCSAPNVVNPLLASLEDQYPYPNVCEAGSHLVVLGGGVDSRVQSINEYEHMSNATMARATEAFRIARNEPALRLVVAGGAVGAIAEADVIASYLTALGIEKGRIVYENRSSNTRENAVNVAALLANESVQGEIRLVTSAIHMPRAFQSFRKVFDTTGTSICPVSVDRQAIRQLPWWAWMPQTTALVKFDRWLHEVVARILYRLRGWI